MKKMTQESKTIYGLKVRTKNEDEMNPQTAKIGKMWGEYFSSIAPTLPQGTEAYGVYANYESDAFGEFDVFAGSVVENATLEKVTLEAGNYLCFKADGELPQAVIDTWGEIWAYFADENCKEKRAFTTDYELYLSESKTVIYIAIKD